MKKFWVYAIIYLVSFTWALPQNLLGFIGFIFLRPLKRFWYKGQIITIVKGSNGKWGFTSGLFIFTNMEEWDYKTANSSGSLKTKLADHELGHAIPQAFVFGPTQLLLCTLPSILWFNFFSKGQDYEKPYWERTASIWGKKVSKYLEKL
jgi:hypothetical protein